MMKKVYTRVNALFMVMCMILGLLVTTAPTEAAKKKEKKVSVYVITKHEVDDDAETSEYYKYTYNKNGFVKKGVSALSTSAYTYKGTRLIKIVETPKKGYDSLEKTVTTNTYDKKGRLKKSVEKSESATTTMKCTYDKKNRLTKEEYIKDNGETKKKEFIAYKYNKKGQVLSITAKDDESAEAMKLSYKYDKKGNPIKETLEWVNDEEISSQSVLTIEYTYKKDRVLKKVETTTYGSQAYVDYKAVHTYTYKKIKVPKKYAAKVKKQQKEIFEKNML
ncbi:MAG: hypothetical protein K6G65_00140 [Lachnospiraceae bacterium]|nr:hypothetical protein [Lachnospiraceae bacterium]